MSDEPVSQVVEIDYHVLAALQEREQQLAEAQRLAELGSWQWDLSTQTLTWSDEMYRLLGLTPQLSTADVNLTQMIHAEDLASVEAVVARLLTTHEPYVIEHRLSLPDGETRWLQIRGAIVMDAGGNPLRVHGTVQDVTDRIVSEQQARSADDRVRSAEQLLAHERLHDPLTGLANRRLLIEVGTRALARARRNGSDAAVLAIGLDNFRRVNTEFGHDVGDELLVATARRLETTIREYDAVARSDGVAARLGGDEFLILCENIHDVRAASTIASRCLEAIAVPVPLGAGEIDITASVGIAVGGDRATIDQLMIDAEAGMRKAKDGGANRFEFFTQELRRRAATNAQTDHALRTALERGEFRLVYQPKVSLVTDRIEGAEALIRWHHPMRGTVGPDLFIPDAEASGAIVDIGTWVLQEACRQAVLWHQQFPGRTPVRVAINVSARQFRVGLVDNVRDAMTESGVDPRYICLEITESTVMDDTVGALATLTALARLGVSISLDDFGTGYSSLAYLHRLPIDEVKIDKSFVDGLGEDPEDTAIVAAVISLAHALDRRVVAEGVETREQLEKLRALGCESAQGYFLARPGSPAKFEELLGNDQAGVSLVTALSHPPSEDSYTRDLVLVADDAADIRQLVRMSLTTVGFNVEEAKTGAEAISMAKELRPACVVLDVSMPDMTGMQVCAALRASPLTAGCTIVMLTSRAESSDKAEAFALGADEYIVKPFAPRDLVARIRTAVRRRLGD